MLSTRTTIAVTGTFGSWKAPSTAGSVVTQAAPLTRTVSPLPGITKSSPALPVRTTFWRVSSRLLPLRSARAMCCASSTRTKPLGPPRGEASALPSSSNVATTAKRHRLMNRAVASSSSARSFSTTSFPGMR